MGADLETLYVTKPGGLMRRAWELLVVDGSDRGRRARIDRSPALLGAAPAAVLVLSDDTVSRYHVEVDVYSHGLRVRDLDSTNGTFVGNRRVREAFIEDGQSFRIGHTSVKIIAHDAPDEPVLPPLLGAIPETLGSALARDGRMRRTFEILRRVAPTDAPILFVGEAGTGKATCARIAHSLSSRRSSSLVAAEVMPDPVTTAGVLFGVTRGKVTTPGAFERASGGSLYLQRVDFLTQELQGQVLATLERGEVVRGETTTSKRFDARLICSAEGSLDASSGFSPRLLRRLGAVRIDLPPLRERSSEVADLARSFLDRRVRPLSLRGDLAPATSVGPQLARTLALEHWPGNIDELREAVIGLSKGWVLPEVASLAERLRAAQVMDALVEQNGNVSEVARRIGAPQLDLFRFLARQRIDLEAMETETAITF
ncbi:MAG: sigma 54-interacting transcriptional regulator [Deltaproteobacteria bacterium]|nr:sigma 54-interacting transcriptional regulator [Deltaproteobacteria bacterium]